MELLSSKECATLLGVTTQTISRLANNREIPFSTVGNRRVFSPEDIESYMKTNNIIAAPQDHARLSEELPNITAVSFFSGALGLDLGMESAGISSQLYCENDLKCRMTINRNRPNAALVGDIRRLNADDIFSYARIPAQRGIDIMFGGPPCQAFSTAGARRAFDDARGNIFLHYLYLAKTIKPKYLIIENVRGLLSTPYPETENGQPVRHGAMRTILNVINEMGYKVSFNLYNAANFGAPQIRERVILIAKRDGQAVPWLTPTNSNDPKWGLPRWKTLRDACEQIQTGTQHFNQFPEKRLKYFRMLKEGQYWRNLPEALQEEAMGKSFKLSGGKTGFYRRLSWDKPSATLVTSPTMPATDLCHPSEDRPLSIEEYAAIQEFPANWSFCGGLSDIYRQIGNAVPIALGKAIGKAIMEDMDGIKSPEHNGFPYSRYRHTNETNWDLD